MSLNVSSALLDRAQAGPVDDDEFIGCIRDSLPYAWQVISDVADRLARGTGAFADDSIPPPSEAERGQLLRALASDAIRTALERHFGAVLAFQNCHRVAAFDPDRLGADYARFVSARAQLLNQSPELRDC
jgi:hypothetical protein